MEKMEKKQSEHLRLMFLNLLNLTAYGELSEDAVNDIKEFTIKEGLSVVCEEVLLFFASSLGADKKLIVKTNIELLESLLPLCNHPHSLEMFKQAKRFVNGEISYDKLETYINYTKINHDTIDETIMNVYLSSADHSYDVKRFSPNKIDTYKIVKDNLYSIIEEGLTYEKIIERNRQIKGYELKFLV